jgi:glycosyltransferase involved in cell wall biosynthesis
MEIIHLVLGKANPERMNGVNKVVYQLATKQFENGLDVSVWGITKDLSHNYGSRVFETKLFKRSFNPFMADRELLKCILLKKGKAVFHLHGGWVPVYSTIAKFLGKNEIPFVFTPHGGYNTIAMQRNAIVKKIYFTLFEKSVLEYSQKIHCIGESEVLGLQGIFNTTKTVLLPYGFQSKFHMIDSSKKESQLIIGFVGRLDIYTKGLDLLIDAFFEFKKQGNNAKLWIVGDGAEQPKLIEMVKAKNLLDDVVFWGGKFGDEKDELLKQMDVFVHPSRNEGLPSSVIEAMNFGVPCVVSKATNMGEYVRFYNAGVAVKNEDANAIKDAFNKLHNLWSIGDLHTMRCNSQRMVKNVFSWNLLIDKFNRLYTY